MARSRFDVAGRWLGAGHGKSHSGTMPRTSFFLHPLLNFAFLSVFVLIVCPMM